MDIYYKRWMLNPFPMARAYLDHNATTPLRDCARIAMMNAMAINGNASSIHGEGRSARKLVEDARRTLADIFDVTTGQIIFTSGATEANNAILNIYRGQRILVGSTEHASVAACDVPHEFIPVDVHGIIRTDVLDEMLRAGTVGLVSIMYVNNETGVMQDIAAIADIVHKYGALLHVDCVQALGRITFTREAIKADFITLSAHKIGGPFGAGAIIMKAGMVMTPFITGGGQEKRMRAGTENIPAISGLGTACAEAVNEISEFQKLEIYRAHIEAALLENGYPVFGHGASRVSNTICFSYGKNDNAKDAQTLLMAFDLGGVALSSGSACSSGTVQDSRVLKAMGADPIHTRSALRLSMGYTTTKQDVDLFLKIWDKVRG